MRKILKLEAYSDKSADMGAKLSAKAKPKTDSKKPDPWVIELSGTDSVILAKYCESHVISTSFAEQEEAAKTLLTQICFDAFVNKFVSDKARPSSPEVKSDTGDHVAMFILQDKYKVNLHSPSTDPEFSETWGRAQAIAGLKEAGLSAAQAQKFVDAEVEILIPTHFLTLPEMIDGHYGKGRTKVPPTAETRSAGEKIQRFLLWRGKGTLPSLTDAEQEAITYKKFEWHLKPGMLDRICLYAKTPDDMKAIFSVFSPVLSFRNQEVMGTAPAVDRNMKLRKMFNSVFPE
jgi:hypothetical protein